MKRCFRRENSHACRPRSQQHLLCPLGHLPHGLPVYNMRMQETVCSLLAAHMSERLASGELPPPLRDPASPAERFLAGFPCLNPFSAACLLAAAKSLRRLITMPSAERAPLAAAVTDMPAGSLELFYQQLEYGSRLLLATGRAQEVRDGIDVTF